MKNDMNQEENNIHDSETLWLFVWSRNCGFLFLSTGELKLFLMLTKEIFWLFWGLETNSDHCQYIHMFSL